MNKKKKKKRGCMIRLNDVVSCKIIFLIGLTDCDVFLRERSKV